MLHFTISHFNFYVSQMTSIDIDCAIWREKCLSFKEWGRGWCRLCFCLRVILSDPDISGGETCDVSERETERCEY